MRLAGIIYYDYSQAEPMCRAAQILGIEDVGELYSSPRFYYPKEEGVAEVRDIINSLNGSDSGERVIYFANADILNVSCQNALLKTIEDRDDVTVIFVASKRMLDTVESRCQIFRYLIPTLDDFTSSYLSKGKSRKVDDARWLYVFSKGHIDIAEEICCDDALMNTLRTLYERYRGPGSISKRSLFELFHMMKEKDPDCFCDKYKSLMPSLYRMLSVLLYKKALVGGTCTRHELEDLAVQINIHARKVSISRSYTKNDFFMLLMAM